MDTLINLLGVVLIPLALFLFVLFCFWLCGQAYENTTGKKL